MKKGAKYWNCEEIEEDEEEEEENGERGEEERGVKEDADMEEKKLHRTFIQCFFPACKQDKETNGQRH